MFRKTVLALALPALLLLRKFVVPALLMPVMPLVSALTTSNVAPLPTATAPRMEPVTPPLPIWSVPPEIVVPPL